jgi:hypothetical protein
LLSKANFPITTAIRHLSVFGISASFISPTKTGLEKSIMDAHGSLRDLLARTGVHDFTIQSQGTAGKRLLPIALHLTTGIVDSQVSLYRPESKEGDPRIWISGLPKYAKPTDLIAIWVGKNQSLHSLNFSDVGVEDALSDEKSKLTESILNSIDDRGTDIVSELLDKLRAISSRGYVETLRKGDTGVGFTLESMLGISANSSKNPDYKGIELKTKRVSAKTRSNLFSQVPDWKMSSCKSGLEVLNRVGYVDQARNRLALYVTVSSTPNQQGLFFKVDEEEFNLQSMHKSSDGKISPVNYWDLELLKERLLHKHSETFWVDVKKKVINGIEHFLYSSVTHTKSPIADYFGPLIESNVITMDYTLHLKESGNTRDHGYLFKIMPEDLELLFPPPIKYDLTQV